MKPNIMERPEKDARPLMAAGRHFLNALILAAVFCSCEKDPGTESGTPEFEVYDVVPVAEQGWDIYTGTGYRYGASIIVNDDESVDLWLAAPGGTFGEGVKTYLSDEQEAQQLGTDGTLAQYFEFDESFARISLYCPSWNSTQESFTLSIYEWNSDYAGTVAGEPLASRRFEKYGDNSWLDLYAGDDETGTEKFPAGKYLWVMSDGTANSGIWKCTVSGSSSQTNARSYVDGEEISGQFFSMICTSAGSNEIYWDKIVYMHSDDGGKTWTDEVPTLLPTEGGRDSLSCCDPGVACWGGYYYIGYTSTMNQSGRYNHVYMARGTSPDGPWEKWNGSGWGGDPSPVVTYDGTLSGFGAGEPCIVVLDGTVYLYYSWNEWNTVTTMLSTAPADDENWPARLESRGVVIDKTDMEDPDHTDVKYVERSRKFVAIHAVERDTDDSWIQIWESEDGISFTKAGQIRGELCKGIINAGMSGDGEGHVRPDIVQYLCYAHSDEPRTWGHWATWWSPMVWERPTE